jgi:ribosomal protein L15
LGLWAFREVFYSFSGPGGYLSPTGAATAEPRRAGAGAEAAIDTRRGVRARGAEDAAVAARCRRGGGDRGGKGASGRKGERGRGGLHTLKKTEKPLWTTMGKAHRRRRSSPESRRKLLIGGDPEDGSTIESTVTKLSTRQTQQYSRILLTTHRLKVITRRSWNRSKLPLQPFRPSVTL